MHAADLLTARARLTPDREALLDLRTGQRYTYAELNARANRAANFLREGLGVQAGDRVSILAHNNIAYVDLFYAVAKIGALFAPLNWRLTAHELDFIVNDCGPRVLIVSADFVHVWQALSARVPVPQLVGLEGAALGDVPMYETEIERASSAEPTRPALHDDTPYCLLYTSGTTG
ncbi:MAG: AMP-binding protein, partial [Anaerolineales bacterium]|nr:AMP-binding protein [Anaerolineales bacterium]